MSKKRPRGYSNDDAQIDIPPATKRPKHSVDATEKKSQTLSPPSISPNNNNNPIPNNTALNLGEFSQKIQRIITEFADPGPEDISFIPTKSADEDVGKLFFNVICPSNMDNLTASLGIFEFKYWAYRKSMYLKEFKDNGYHPQNKPQFMKQTLNRLLTDIFNYEYGEYTAIDIVSVEFDNHQISPKSLLCLPYSIPDLFIYHHYFIKPAAPNPIFDETTMKQYQYDATILIKDKGGFVCNVERYGNNMVFKRKCLIFCGGNSNRGIQIYFDLPIRFMVTISDNDIPFKLSIDKKKITGKKFCFSTKEWSVGDWRFRINIQNK